MFEQVKVQVSGMSCGGCEQRAATVLQRLEGVRQVTADHRSGVVSAEVDPQKVSRDTVAQRLAAAGFEEVPA